MWKIPRFALDAEFEENKHPRGEGGKFASSSSGKSKVVKVEPSARGAVYHVESTEHHSPGSSLQPSLNKLHVNENGDLLEHHSSAAGMIPKHVSKRANPDVHEAVRNHIRQHGYPDKVKGGVKSINTEPKPAGYTAVERQLRKNSAISRARKRAGFY
jgi:hypothetical protein